MHTLDGVTRSDQYRALGLSTFAFTVCFAVWTIFSIIGVKIKGELGLSDTQFGLLVATPVLTGSISRIFLGVWTEQYGGRLIFALQMLITAVAVWLLTSVRTYEVFLLAALGIGLAGGSFIVGIAYVSQWFEKDSQGTALGIFGAGNVGAAVTNFAAPFLVVAMGWEGTARVYAIVLAITAVLFYIFARDEIDPIPGKTMPNVAVVERDYPNLYKRFTALGPLMNKLGNGGKGIGWKTETEVEHLGDLNGVVTEEGPTKGMPRIETDIDAAEVVLMLAPETNGEVAVKAWEALGVQTGREHTHLAIKKEDEKIRFRDIAAQPRKIISSPTWSGLESEHVCYNAGYTNVHELIPWRTLTGRQQLYQDHLWMRAFGEELCTWKPPVDLKTVERIQGSVGNGNPEVVLNFITPHQKWGIHSTYSDNLLMLTLNRGGPVVWLSEADAKAAGIVDNDWVEAYNTNGALTARAVVSQRVNQGMVMMYHAQEKIVNTPGSEVTGNRGGIHNSVTRATLKPTHMIGGYAQQSYGFNYYGTVGSNRDEFVIVRKMKNIDWLERPYADAGKEAAE